jgi:hypothetical protein
MHRPLHLLSPGLVVLTACPVEQTYADLIKKHGNTYSSESASDRRLSERRPSLG